MRIVYNFCLGSLVLFLAISGSYGQKRIQSTNDFTARDITGRKIQLRKLLAEGPVIIDFWATFCVPCLKEMPHLQKIQMKFKNSGVQIVAVNEDMPSELAKVKPFVRQRRYDFIVIIDEDDQLWNQFQIQLLPTTLLIDRSGKIRYTHVGYKLGDENQLIRELERLVAEDSTDTLQ